eukprot:30775-Hanusia_phi.AAC.1
MSAAKPNQERYEKPHCSAARHEDHSGTPNANPPQHRVSEKRRQQDAPTLNLHYRQSKSIYRPNNI